MLFKDSCPSVYGLFKSKVTFIIACFVEDSCRYDAVFKKCESFKGKPNKCEYDDGTITGVVLHTEYSKNECQEGKSWGFDEESIWVNSDCRAKFKLCVKGRLWYFKFNDISAALGKKSTMYLINPLPDDKF